jgi:hypothetical protein
MQAAAGACFAFPLLLAACVTPQAPPPASSAPAGTDARPAVPPPLQDPAPQPQAPPPAGTGQAPSTPGLQPEGLAGSPTPQAGTPPTPETTPSAKQVLADPGPPPAATTSAPPAPRTVTAYYVLLDDGGSRGVRFGCNDSLVGVDRPAGETAEPLAAAVGALLAEAGGTGLAGAGGDGYRGASGATEYNALAGSRLKFLSGTFDGTTVTVYLAGALSLGGACDVPRVEAQLTQTAVAAVGAVRAEVYVNGVPLREALRSD